MTDRILAAVLGVARVKNPALSAIERPHRLRDDLGLDSLDFAQIVAQLELELGIDPFATTPLGDVRTAGDLCDVYVNARDTR